MQQNSSGLHSDLDRVRLVPLTAGDKKGVDYLEWNAPNNDRLLHNTAVKFMHINGMHVFA